MPAFSLVMVAVLAQSAGAAAGTAQAAPKAFTLDVQLQSQFTRSRMLLSKMADRMPADAYEFKPTPDVRTFGQNVMHTAATAFGMCANLVGQPSPQDPAALEKAAADKPTAIKALNDAFAFCDGYVKALTADKLADTFAGKARTPDGQVKPIAITKAGLLANLVAHNNEMYGYMAVYLRLKGIVPPSSDAPAPKK